MKILRTVPTVWRNLVNYRKIWGPLACSTKLLCSNVSSYDQDLQVKGVSLRNYIEKLQTEYESATKGSSNADKNRCNELRPIVSILNQRRSCIENIENLGELLEESDAELRKIAEEEKHSFEDEIKLLNDNLLKTIVPQDPQDSCNSIVLEVNTGVGGQEAMLFAKELFEMYCNFAEYKGWEVQIAEYSITDLGGIRHGSALISGDSAYRYFKYEAGVHRVQRIPATEKGGRIHTSTVSVLALPQPSDIEIVLENKDLKIETKRASGAGGQHVNTTDSAVRIVHIPTGVSVECQVDRSQIKNRQIAMTKLRAMLYQKQLDQQVSENEATRRSQVRSNFRNEKIRTYNYSQDRITDHRLQGSNVHNLKGFLGGNDALDALIEKLDSQCKVDALLNIVNNLGNK